MSQHTGAVDQVAPAGAPGDTHRLTDAQIRYFETFGYLKVPGLFAADIEDIRAGFEDVFANNESWELNEWLHFDKRRSIVPQFIDRNETLRALRDDPRVVGIATSILGPDYEYAESDGSLFFCDSSWHPDIYGAPIEQYHLKLSFYLDPLTAETGAIRMIPGTNHLGTTYANTLYGKLQRPEEIADTFGVNYDEIPSVPIASEPGDLLMWNYRTVHASFGGDERRRLFSISFRQPAATEDPR